MHRFGLGAGEKRGDLTGPDPTNRARPGTKRHLITDAQGIPLALELSGANRNDSRVFESLIDAIPALRNGRRGRPQRRPAKLHADKAYDHRRCRRVLRERNICARIARRGIDSSERLGRHRWVIERTLAWLGGFHKLLIRYERTATMHEALTMLGVCAITARFVERLC